MAWPCVGSFRASHHAAGDPCRNECSLSVAGNLAEPDVEPDRDANLDAVSHLDAFADPQTGAEADPDSDADARSKLNFTFSCGPTIRRTVVRRLAR